jgi:hypothetical protein
MFLKIKINKKFLKINKIIKYYNLLFFWFSFKEKYLIFIKIEFHKSNKNYLFKFRRYEWIYKNKLINRYWNFN